MKEIITIKQEGTYVGTIYIDEEGTFMTNGSVGEYNYYDTFIELLIGLQGHGISIDDLYF